MDRNEWSAGVPGGPTHQNACSGRANANARSGIIAAFGAWLEAPGHNANANLALVQKMVGHESVTAMAGHDRHRDAAKRKAADLVHVQLSRDSPKRAAIERNDNA